MTTRLEKPRVSIISTMRSLSAVAALFTAALASLILAGASAAGSDAGKDHLDNQDIVGRWTVTRVLDSAAVAGMSDRQARKLIGKQILIDKESLSFNGRTCRQPGYQRSVEDLPRSFREQGHVSSYKMGLPDPVTTIDAGCTYLFLKKPNQIVIAWDGFYFDAIRASK